MAPEKPPLTPPGTRSRPDLSPVAVARRLADLRQVSVLEHDTDARTRLARERPAHNEPFDRAVERRLRELHALCELADYLHRGVVRNPSE